VRHILKTSLYIVLVLLLRHAPAFAQSLSNYGTLSDEKAAYQKWGWTWSSSQEPSIPTGLRAISRVDVHNELEADDLWQNIVMWKRTGNQGYYDLAASWAQYYKNSYATDYKTDLNGFFGDHTFGWGLVEWSKITNDNSYLAAANKIGDDLQAAWYADFATSVKAGFYGLRGPGRHLKLAVALGRRQWADDIWTQLRNSFRWEERTINSATVGFWKEDASAFSWATGATGAISSFEFAVLNEGISDYYELTGDAEAKRRLILMARFAQQYGMDSAVNHTGHWILVDFPSKDSFFHTGLAAGVPLDPFYTSTLVNVLVRGYLLSGDVALLNRAKFVWDRSSKAKSDDAYPYTNRTPDNQVGHFMNSQMLSGGLFYISDGELPYVGLLFTSAGATTSTSTTGTGTSSGTGTTSGTGTGATGSGTAAASITESWKLLPNSSLRTVLSNTSYISSPGPDGWSYPLDNIVKDWNGGIIDTKRKMLIVPAAGGHNSWFYNDVWGYDAVNFQWVNLRKSYMPYMTQAEADRTRKVIYDDGSPATVHTYDGIAYLDQLDEVFMIGGPGWNSTGQGPPPRRFSMSTATWSYGTSQNIYPENGTSSAVNPADGTVWFRTFTRLYSYDVKADRYKMLSENLPSPQTYYTAQVINGVYYMVGGGEVIRIAPGGQATKLSLSGDPLPAVPAPGVAWEPAIQRLVVWGGGTDVYFVNLSTSNVSLKRISGDNPGPPQGLGTYKRFGRVSQGQYLLLNSIHGVYSLTLDTGQAPPASSTSSGTSSTGGSTGGTSTGSGSGSSGGSTGTPAGGSTGSSSGGSTGAPAGGTATVPVTIEAEVMPTRTTGGGTSDGWNIWSNGYIETDVSFPNTGRYRFTIYARGQVAAGVPPDMELRIDQQAVKKIAVPASTYTQYVIDTDVTRGTHKVAIAFTNDYYNDPEDRNLYVDKMTISAIAGFAIGNRAPVVDVGPDRTIQLPTSQIDLSAVVTDDGLPKNTVTLLWTVVAGTGVRLDRETTQTPTASFPGVGNFVLRLAASDGDLSSSDDLTVNVLPRSGSTGQAQAQDHTAIIGPKDGEVLQGRLTPIIASTRLDKVTKLEVRIDGELKATSASNSIKFVWDPKDLGTHTVEIFAMDSTTVLGYWVHTVVVK